MRKSTLQYLLSHHQQNAKKAAHAAKPLVPMLAILFLQFGLANSASAATEVWTTTANSVLSEFNAILRPVSVVAIIIMGLAAGFGKMEWGTVAKIAAGIIVANGATTIVDYLTTNGGGSSS